MKTPHKRTGGGVLLSLILALALGAGLVSCASDDNTTENETVTITLVSESRTSGTSYTIEKGTAIADITSYVDPTKDGYTFGGWQNADGKAYSTSTKINSSVTLFAKWSAKPNTVSNTDGTTITTTNSQITDGSSSTTEVTKDSEGKTTKTTTTTEKSDGTKVTETVSDGKTTTETVNADNSSSTTTVTTASDGTTTTTTETKDSSGKSTGKTIVEEKEDGTVTTKVTDASGKETTTTSTKKYKEYISAGIANLESATPDIESAISNFNKAYETEANDETRVYSALASLASISTTSATASFFKNHLGITNYPSTMNALFADEWLEAENYIDYTDSNYIYGYSEFTAVDSSSSSNYYSRYYRCSIAPADSYFSGSTQDEWGIYKQATINGESVYVNLYNLAEYEKNTTGTTQYTSYYYTYTLNDNGEYYVYIPGSSSPSDLSSHTAYKQSGGTEVSYTYEVHTKFATLSVPDWFKSSSLSNNLSALLLANILNGNTKGLNSALDDFYSLIFDSSEYKDAISKLDAITTSVKVPSNVIRDFGLTDIVGNSAVKLGPAELGLVKTAFTALKAVIEYFQSYDLNVSLSSLKFDWENNQALKSQLEKYLAYDSSSDPLKLLTVRSASKMASAKSDLASAVGDLIAAYDDILSNTGDYPAALTDTLDEYKILKSGAELLKSAITNGGKFYIPDAKTEADLASLSSWPASGDKYVDFGKVFTAGYLSTSSFLDEDGDGKITIYNISERYSSATGEYYYELGSEYKYDSSTGIGSSPLGIKISLSPVQNLFAGYDSFFASSAQKDSNGNYYVVQEVPVFMAIYIYNFYNNGAASDEIKKYLDGIATDAN